jgi:hypothetical protein
VPPPGAAPLPLPAGPVAPEYLSAQPRWLGHFDADRYRATKLGEYYVKHVMERHLTEAKAKHGFDFGPLLRSLKSATAYGTGLEKNSEDAGVLLLQAAPAAVDEFAIALAAWLALDKDHRIERLQDQPFALFEIDRDVLIAPLADGRLMVGKSRTAVTKACDVVRDQAPNLASTPFFKELRRPGAGFIVVAAVEDLHKNKALPPQAKIFRMAENGQLTLDERGEQLVLNVSLKAESEQAATQMKQLAEGLIAWAAMTKPDDQELQTLLKTVSISTAARTVTAKLEYPVERVRQKLEEETKSPVPAKQTPTK